MPFLHAYVVDARWFAFLHLILFLFATWQLREFHAWQPRGTAADWQQLESRSQFVRGVIGLFLLVGIAGTFYALWGFATAVQEAKNNDAQFFDALAQAMAKAFPVGIVGLFLTLAFSVIADALERAKARGLSLPRGPASVEEALQRGLAQVGDVIGSGIASFERSLAAGFNSIEETLRPVRTLQDTLSGSLEPIIRQLGSRLAEATQLLQAQGDRLEAGKAALVGAAAELASSARTIAETLSQLSQTTKEIRQSYQSARRLADETVVLHEQSRQSLEALASGSSALFQRAADQLGQIEKALASTEERFRSLPEELRAELAASLLTVVKTTTEQAATSLADVAERASERLADTFNTISSDLERHRERVEAVASALDSLYANLRNTQEEVAAGLHSALAELAREFTRAVGERAREAVGPLDRVATEAEGIRTVLRPLPQAADALRHEIEGATANLRKHQQELRDAVIHTRQVLERETRRPQRPGKRHWWWPF